MPPSIYQEKLEAILANAVDAIITIDQAGIIESVNPATQRLFGYAPEEIVGCNVNRLMPEPYRNQHDTFLENYLETGVKKIIGIGREVVGQRKDGSTFPIHLAVSEFHFEDKRLFTGIVRDISDVKSVEAQLVQNVRLAAIGQMMAGLAHESRNAFQRSHACLTNLAFDVREMPESLELVGKIRKALDHLNALLDEVRDYSAPIILEKSLIDIESLIRETWSQITIAHYETAKIEFSIERFQDFPEKIKADRVRIGQVVWNLLENAHAACGNSDGRIQIRLRVDRGRGLNVIEFHDNGPGVPAETKPQIFEPFFTTKTKGTGLGLAICRRIINAHDGNLSVSDGDLSGACFQIQI